MTASTHHTWQEGLKTTRKWVDLPPSQSPINPLTCPNCNSSKIWKDGFRKPSMIQRYLCRDCGFRFSWKTESLKLFPLSTSSHQVCVTDEGSKNLVSALEKYPQKLGYGETTETNLLKDFPEDIQGKILEYAVKRLNQGKNDSGVKAYLYSLRSLVRHGCDLKDPESVKIIVRQMNVSNRTKDIRVRTYDSFAKFLGIQWEKPIYRFSEKEELLPLEEDIDMLIAGCSKNVATYLQVVKATGARKNEVGRIKWEDVDFDRHTISINYPEKGSNTRTIPVSERCISMVSRLDRKNEKLFKIHTIEKMFYNQRKKIAYKTSNPKLLKIHFHLLRHWKGTMEAHRSRSYYHVQYILGHKNVKNTERYIRLADVIFKHGSDEFHVATARTPEEASKLIEAGFEKQDEFDGVHLYRKRK